MTALIGKFAAGVATRQMSRWEFQLLEPLAFNDPVHGLREVPAGFVSDLASIRILREICRWCAMTALSGTPFSTALPWLNTALWIVAVIALALYGLTAGYGMRASILHDWEYRLAQLSRKECDDMYERALHTGDGTARWRSLGLFWIGVRIGGWRQYGKPD